MKNKIDFIFSCIKKVFFETTMRYIISHAQSHYVKGIVDILIHLKKANAKTLWDFFSEWNNCHARGEFLWAMQELNRLGFYGIKNTYYKFVDDKYVELFKEEKDEADYVEVIN